MGPLVTGDTTEPLITSDKITSLPSVELRRDSYGEVAAASALRLSGGHALLLGDIRQRLTLKEHGASPLPLFLGVERDQFRRRPMTLGRRDDGAVGVLVLDGSAPEAVGFVEIDRTLAL